MCIASICAVLFIYISKKISVSLNVQHPQLTLDLGAAPEPTFSNFIEGENAPALSALRAAQEANHARTGVVQPIFLWGPPGSGKSHLLQACTWANCFDDLQTASQAEQRDIFIKFTQLISEPSTAIIVAADRPPLALEQLGIRQDLTSRLAQSLVFELKPLSDEQVRLALALTIAERGLSAQPELVEFLMNRLPRDMGRLRAAFDALDRLSLVRKKPLSVALANELIQSGW
jgi:DnaA-homolog protein